MTNKMNRETAYRAQAATCRSRAAVDIERRDFWIAEAVKWEQRARQESGDDSVAYEIKDDGAPDR